MAYDPWGRVLLFWIVEAEICVVGNTVIIHITFRGQFSGTPAPHPLVCPPAKRCFLGEKGGG